MNHLTAANNGVGLRSLTVSFPQIVRTNDYFRQHSPELVADAERKSLARVFSTQDATPRLDTYEREMNPYLQDPFRGSVERRVLAADETALTIETKAATAALEAAGLTTEDVDLLLVCSFLPDQLGPGNAVFLARSLGLRAPAWNIESTCSSALAALQTAASVITAGQFERVLVVVSCTYSRVTDDSDTMAWWMGDGAGAFVVGRVPKGTGVLGFKTINTVATCGTFYNELVNGTDGRPRNLIRASPRTGRAIRDISEPALRTCCEGAAEAANVSLSDIDFFVFNTPVAWYADYCARTLGIGAERTVNTYPLYANIGPALMPANLYHAARSGKINDGDLVLAYTIGSASTASAVVMRWQDVVLGPSPLPSSELVQD
jgi:3-oxoacyl-[acyl-carrier-protein] synthase-3